MSHYEILHFCYFCRIYSVFTCIHSRNRDMGHRIIIRQIDTIFSQTYIITIHFTSFLNSTMHVFVFDLVHLILHLYFILGITVDPCSLILLLLAGDVELNLGPSALTFTHLNIRSIRSFENSSSLHNYLADHPTDILSLNETWLQPTDSDNFISSLAPSGFSIFELSSSYWSWWWSCCHS